MRHENKIKIEIKKWWYLEWWCYLSIDDDDNDTYDDDISHDDHVDR